MLDHYTVQCKAREASTYVNAETAGGVSQTV